jgi:hypothetical protein
MKSSTSAMYTFAATSFDTKDLDSALWELRALTEAKLIFGKESTRRGRTWEDVLSVCMQGQAAEIWLMSQGFTNDERNYHDVIHPSGTSIEVKVTSWNARYILDRYAEKLKGARRAEWPTTVYVFYNELGSSLYVFHGIFHWNGERFIGTKP